MIPAVSDGFKTRTHFFPTCSARRKPGPLEHSSPDEIEDISGSHAAPWLQRSPLAARRRSAPCLTNPGRQPNCGSVASLLESDSVTCGSQRFACDDSRPRLHTSLGSRPRLWTRCLAPKTPTGAGPSARALGAVQGFVEVSLGQVHLPPLPILAQQPSNHPKHAKASRAWQTRDKATKPRSWSLLLGASLCPCL